MIRFRRVRTSRRGDEVTAVVEGPGPDDAFDLWFRSSGARLTAAPEAFVTAALPVAMGHGVALRAPGRVSPRFAESIDRWQRTFAAWLPDELSPTTVEAKTRRPRPPSTGVGAFFTGGVDSFYTVLEHRERLDGLVYVWGYDLPLEQWPELRQEVAVGVRTAAAELEVPLVEIETNLHDWSDLHGAAWGTTYHAVALAAVAHLLTPSFGELLVGSTYTYRDLFAWGSTPITDPLLGSDLMTITHDGCEADRVERIRRIAESDVALRHLRVCWENRDLSYNCGVCEKCIRTMIALQICGKLDQCATLPAIDIDRVRALPHNYVAVVARLVELVDHLRRTGSDPELLAACEASLHHQDPSIVRWDLDWRDVMPLLFEREQ